MVGFDPQKWDIIVIEPAKCRDHGGKATFFKNKPTPTFSNFANLEALLRDILFPMVYHVVKALKLPTTNPFSSELSCEDICPGTPCFQRVC